MTSKKAKATKKAAASHQDNHARPSDKNKQTVPASPKNRPSRTTTGAPIFFFKDDEEPHGFLCQWYKCRFTDPESGLEFRCAEQWMMWHKAQLAGDATTAAAIMASSSPRKQKQLGREVVGFDAAAWDEVKLGVVERGNYLKFTQATNVASFKMGDDAGAEPVPLRELLLATGERELDEASRFDRVWGIGFDAQHALATPREKWGQSLLGEALMNVRDRIRREMGV